MNTVSFAKIVKLSDRELLARVQVLADKERGTMAALIAHLAVMDERRLYLGEGCSSLFSYCMRVLHFSESAAYRRVEAARTARRFPVILEMLTAGRINLTTIRLLAPELTPANHRNLLEAATHKSRLEVQKLIVGRSTAGSRCLDSAPAPDSRCQPRVSRSERHPGSSSLGRYRSSRP